MTEKIEAFVLDVVKYSDNRNVITMFSRSRGRISCISSSGGKTGRGRNAMLQPLSVITTDMNFNSQRDLQRLGRIELGYVWKSIYFNPYKSAVGIFLAEFLNRYLRTAAPDAPAYDFVVGSLRCLDSMDEGIANFHLAFIIRFLEVAGISPDITDYEKGDYFDMQESVCTPVRPTHNACLTAEQASYLPLLMRMNYRNCRFFRFNARQRREIMSLCLKYYSLFFPGLDRLKSPEVLQTLFE